MTPPLPPLPDGSDITADDIERAKLAFRKAAPPEFKNLLDAESEPPTGTP